MGRVMPAYRAIDDPEAIDLLDRVIRVCESSDPDSWGVIESMDAQLAQTFPDGELS